MFEYHPIRPRVLKVLKFNAVSNVVMNLSSKITAEKADNSSHAVVVIK